MGKGAYLTFINQTSLKLQFGTSDKNNGWQDDTIDCVKGEIEPNGQSERFYIEADGWYAGDSSVKFTVQEYGVGSPRFANVQVIESGNSYRHGDTYQNRLQAQASIDSGDQYEVRLCVTLAASFEPANWMRDLPDTLTLKQVCIPGSHDAGMYELDKARTLGDQAWYLQVGEVVSKYNLTTHLVKFLVGEETSSDGVVLTIAKRLGLTQSQTLYGQLVAGSRFFDLRPAYRTDTQRFHLKHGKAVGPELRPVLLDVVHFLNEYQAETVFLSFSHFEELGAAGSAQDQQLVKLLTDCIPATMRYCVANNTALATVALSKLRGKIILLLDDDSHFAQQLSADSASGVFRLNKSLPLFNEYANAQHYDKMLPDQAGKFHKFENPAIPGSSTLFMLNWTLTPVDNDDKAAISGPSVQEYAANINPRLTEDVRRNAQDLFGANGAGHMVNIINLDYVETANAVPACLEIMRRCHHLVGN